MPIRLRVLMLSVLSCTSTSFADLYVVSPKTGAPSGNLSPALLIIRMGGGTYVGETEEGLPVFDLRDDSPLVTAQSLLNIPYHVKKYDGPAPTQMRELICSWRAGTRPTNEELAEAGFKIIEEHPRGTFLVCQPTKPIPLSAESIKKLSVLRSIEHAEFNHRVKVVPIEGHEAEAEASSTQAVRDPLYKKLWGLQRIGVVGAWNSLDSTPKRSSGELFSGTEDIIVAVIDTGVDYNHPDLKANMWVNKGEIPNNGIDDDKNGVIDDVHGASFVGPKASGDPMDDNGHGTHCAGTIGAVANDIGVVGVNRRVKIMALKFLTANGGGNTADAIQCIHYALDNGARILSNSWGGGGATREMLEVIQESKRERTLFVAAAGNAANNNDTNPSFPASYPVDNVVAVAAIGEDGGLARFSNFGVKQVDIAAPGVNILSTFPNAKYKALNGTSMATPHVSGAFALFWKHPNNNQLHWNQVLAAFYGNASKSPKLNGKVAGARELSLKFMAAPPKDDGPTKPVPGKPAPPNAVAVSFNQFYHAKTQSIQQTSNILSVEFELPRASNVLIEANTSAGSPKASQVFASGFGLAGARGNQDWNASFSICNVDAAGGYSNVSSSYAVQLPAGKHTVYWKLRIAGKGEVHLRGGGSMVVKAFPR